MPRLALRARPGGGDRLRSGILLRGDPLGCDGQEEVERVVRVDVGKGEQGAADDVGESDRAGHILQPRGRAVDGEVVHVGHAGVRAHVRQEDVPQGAQWHGTSFVI